MCAADFDGGTQGEACQFLNACVSGYSCVLVDDPANPVGLECAFICDPSRSGGPTCAEGPGPPFQYAPINGFYTSIPCFPLEIGLHIDPVEWRIFDTDGDGVLVFTDLCPDTPPGPSWTLMDARRQAGHAVSQRTPAVSTTRMKSRATGSAESIRATTRIASWGAFVDTWKSQTGTIAPKIGTHLGKSIHVFVPCGLSLDLAGAHRNAVRSGAARHHFPNPRRRRCRQQTCRGFHFRPTRQRMLGPRGDAPGSNTPP